MTVSITHSYVTAKPNSSDPDLVSKNAWNDAHVVDGLGTAAELDAGVSAGNLVQLDGDGKLPAVDGSQLTNISGGGGLSAVVDDTSPQLGGDLDLNTNDITGTGDIDITGDISLSGNMTASGYGAFQGGSMGTQFSVPGVYLGIESNGNAQFNIVSNGTYGYFDIGGINEDYKFRFLTTIASGNTDLQTSGTVSVNGSLILTAATGQPLDSDLTAIAGLSPSNDDIVQRKAGAWTNRSMAQLASDLSLSATYQPLDSDLTAISALSPTNDDIVQRKAGAWTNRSMAQLASDLGLAASYQPLDSDLTAFSALTPTNDDIVQRKAGAWANRSMAQLATDLGLASSYQPLDADLTTIAGLTATTDNFLQSKSSAWASRTPAQVTADLPAVVGDSGSGGTKGLVPAPSAGDAAANKYLKANGAWATVSAGGGSVVWISTGTASSSATLDFTGLDTTTYKSFLLRFRNVVPATSGQAIYIRVGTGAGPTYQTTGYKNNSGTTAAITAIDLFSFAAGSAADASVNNAANLGLSGDLVITNLDSGSAFKYANGFCSFRNSSDVVPAFYSGFWNTATAITALRIMFASGNISTGSVDLYGVKVS